MLPFSSFGDVPTRLFYAMIVNGGSDILEMHLEEIYPVVHRIVDEASGHLGKEITAMD